MPVEIAIIGAGPAGLMAAEALALRVGGQAHITVYDSMRAPARKFLMAGKSGLNISHTEAHEKLKARFRLGADYPAFYEALDSFTAVDVQAWMTALDVEWYVGSSGRLYPKAMKAAPLLRAWLKRLTELGVQFKARHKLSAIESQAKGAWRLQFDTQNGPADTKVDRLLIATGGGSWSRLGSDGAMVDVLAAHGVSVRPFAPSNCGILVDWRPEFINQYAGQVVKSICVRSSSAQQTGDFVISKTGIEGSAVYAGSFGALAAIEKGDEPLFVDLLPDRTIEYVQETLRGRNKKVSLSNFLRKSFKITGVKAALLKEWTDKSIMQDNRALAAALKALPVASAGLAPLDRAISARGGVCFSGLDSSWQIANMPGVYLAGEVLDWDAPTGGYLLTACMAQGKNAGHAIAKDIIGASD